jgi:hypothetical protein
VIELRRSPFCVRCAVFEFTFDPVGGTLSRVAGTVEQRTSTPTSNFEANVNTN